MAAPTDADADCDPDSTDTDDGDRDVDDDLVPDGVELANNSNPLISDTDGDGASDYEEIFQFTDPQDVDSDNDGQADKQDIRPTWLTESSDAADLTDDNCPTEANPSQLNTDSLYQYHGMGVGTGDRTNPSEDVLGDACDSDDDNDALLDATEPLVRIIPWSGPTDPGGQCTPAPSCSTSGDVADTSVCVGVAMYPAAAMPVRTLSPVLGDSDFDLILDGRECQFRSRPDASCRASIADAGCAGGGATAEAKNCSSGTIGAPLALGCAQPATNATTPGGGDTDADGLYMPGTAATHQPVEIFFRTLDINVSLGVQVDDIDGDGAQGDADADSDRDVLGASGTFSGIRDGWEVRYYNTSPATDDTDQDGCPDGEEILDINGDGVVSAGDQGLLAQANGSHDSAPANGRMDTNVANAQGVNHYALAANRDFNKDGQNNPADVGLMASAIATVANCTSFAGVGAGEGTVSVGSATKALP